MAITRNEEVRDGKPVVKGTRITVGDIVERFYSLGRSTEQISSDLGVESSEVEEALRYYHREVLGRREPAGDTVVRKSFYKDLNIPSL
jgi:uncharacterized protein (DUF433 family)